MLSEDVCPKCESSNTETVDYWHDERGDAYASMHCRDCHCMYRCKWVEVLDSVAIEGEDY